MILSLSDIPLVSGRSRSTQSRPSFGQTTFIPFDIRLMWYCYNVGLGILEYVISIKKRDRTFSLCNYFPVIGIWFKTFFTRQRVNQWVKYDILFANYLIVRKFLIQGVLNVIVEYPPFSNSLSLIHFYLRMSLSLIYKQLRPLIDYFSLFTHLAKSRKTGWNPLITKIITANKIWGFDRLILIHNTRQIYGWLGIF